MGWSQYDIGCCCVADPCGNSCEPSPWFDDFSSDTSSAYDDFAGSSLAISSGRLYTPDIRPTDINVGKCFNVPVAFTIAEAEIEYEISTVDSHFFEVVALGVSTYLGVTGSAPISVLRRNSGGANLDTDAVAYATGKLRVVITDVGSDNVQIDRIVYNAGSPYLSHTETVSRASLAISSGDAVGGILCTAGYGFRAGAAALSSTDECWFDNFLADWTE